MILVQVSQSWNQGINQTKQLSEELGEESISKLKQVVDRNAFFSGCETEIAISLLAARVTLCS